MSNDNPNINTSASQRKKVAAHLLAGGSLTARQADDDYGCARLASRIGELRQAGMNIITTMIPVRNRDGKRVRIAVYHLEGAYEVAA